MKKITSLMVMLVLCCVGAFAQATEFADKLIKLGTVQAEMVPGQWYFVHTPRNPHQSATAFGLPGDIIQSAGGLVYEQGAGNGELKLTATSVIDELTAEEGISANANMDKLIRFVAVEGKEGAFKIEFGTGNFLAGSPANGTVTRYNESSAGEYNFYLVTIGGNPNTAGRFAWNKYNMADRIDNNGAGNGVVFWASGETTAEGEGQASDAEIVGNKIWQIYDVVVTGNEDKYQSEYNALVDVVAEIDERDDFAYVENLREGINVGDSYGNYRPEDVTAFLALYDRATEIMGEADSQGTEYLKTVFPTSDDMKAFREELVAADEKVRNNRIPLAVDNIAPGYYTINSMLNWTVTKNDTVYYTQEECDELNTQSGIAEGEEGFLTPDSVKEVQSSNIPAPVKSLYANTYNGEQWLTWGNREEKSQFLWKIETVEGRPYAYRLINMYKGQTFNDIPTSARSKLVEDDTVTVVFDYMGKDVAPVIEEEVTSYGIRLAKNNEGEQHYVHCGGHNGGAGEWGYTVGWGANGIPASNWYLAPVDDATAEAWMESDAAKLQKMFDEANNILATVPAQFEVAKDILVTIHENDSVITDASQIIANSTTLDARQGITIEDTYAFLLDGNPATFWHSAWEGGAVAAHTHYLQITANEALEGLYSVKLSRRAGAGNDHPTKLAVRGYDEDNSELGFEDGDSLGVLTFPFSGAGKVDVATSLFEGKGHIVYRFYWEESAPAANQRGYWHCGDFNIFKATSGTVHEKTQYQVREALITRLQAAMDAWTAAEYSVENEELYADAAFQAAYKELTEAAEAWAAVYVDPAALREAIENAPADNMFVEGTNPGQWPAGAVTPTATVNGAKAYDEAAAYTPAESKKWIEDIASATEQAFAAANKVETGKWYRIKFPTEAMYDEYGWDKTGAKANVNELTDATVNPELFGKTLAVGKGMIEYIPYTNDEDEPDTLTTYMVAAAEEVFEGDALYFFDSEDPAYSEDQDLFRFIQATDSSYIMQHKATGLFVNAPGYASYGVILSTTPSYYQVSAVGAGANIIGSTTVLGEKPSVHVNFHGQRADNKLVCWESTNIASNSALLIEEVEAVAEEPATAYQKKLWPGSVYAYTAPVDIAVGEGATAYGVELAVAEEDTTVILKAIEAETIKAGTPYILIADLVGDYITPADRLKEIASEILADEGAYGKFEQQIANENLDAEYGVVEMNHGMVVDTLQKGNGDLVGTFRSVTIDAGKALITKDNGFAHTPANTTISAYAAYVKCDFDPAGPDMAGTIRVKIDGSIDSGINDILNNVAKSGNIYTVDGKLVGKGNINAINKMPAGVYIINGAKVVKN